MFKYLLLFCCLIAISGCYNTQEVLFYNITQDNADRVIVILANNNIDVEKQIQKDGDFNILIKESDRIKALKILNTYGGGITPDYTNLGEVFKKDGFISSPLEEHARLEYALDQEISSMLNDIGGVISVKTEVGLPTPNDNLWQATDVKPTVSVLVKYTSGSQAPLYARNIKELVCHSIPNLSLDNVYLLMVEQQNDRTINQ